MRPSHKELCEAFEALIIRLVLGEFQVINRQLDRIEHNQRIQMASQSELAAQLNDLGVELGKIGGETTILLQKITDLEAQLAAGSTVTPELQAAFDAVKAQAQVVDDLVPDAPAP